MSFTLNSHLDLAHQYWRRLVNHTDVVIDATCGNGYDTLVLASLTPKQIYAFDLQQEAIESSHSYLERELSPELFSRIQLIHRCHSVFPEQFKPNSVKLIVYNLGYLPRGDKSVTTKVETTLASVKQGQDLLQQGGLISIVCYPGHEEGKREQDCLLEYVKSLDSKTWNCCHHEWINRVNSPSLLLIQKRD